MTDSDLRHPLNLDRLNEFLDGDSDNAIDLSAIPKDEFAKHLLVAGVTRHLLREAADGSLDTVRAGMAAIRADGRGAHRQRNRILGGLAAAAAVIITTFIIFMPPPGFEPLLDRITGFVTDDIDREYKISLETKRIGRLPFSPTLYVRGTDRYAAGFEVRSLGRELGVWQGCDGEDHWLVVPDFTNLFEQGAHTPIFVTSGSADLWDNDELRTMRSISTGIDQIESALGIFELLSELEQDYKIDNTPKTATKIALGEGEVDITAYRNPQANITIPDTIRLIVEEDTGVVRVTILTFVEVPNMVGFENPFRGIRYELVQESIEADNRYEHDSYHDADRPVLRR